MPPVTSNAAAAIYIYIPRRGTAELRDYTSYTPANNTSLLPELGAPVCTPASTRMFESSCSSTSLPILETAKCPNFCKSGERVIPFPLLRNPVQAFNAFFYGIAYFLWVGGSSLNTLDTFPSQVPGLEAALCSHGWGCLWMNRSSYFDGS